MILNEVPWVPFTLLIKSSSGAHFCFVRHYARSGSASAEWAPNRVRSTQVERNAQSQDRRDTPNRSRTTPVDRNVHVQVCFKQSNRFRSTPIERNARSVLQVVSPNNGSVHFEMWQSRVSSNRGVPNASIAVYSNVLLQVYH